MHDRNIYKKKYIKRSLTQIFEINIYPNSFQMINTN